MSRIVYALFSNGGVAGGQKMALRHVETLVDLGFDAVCYLGTRSVEPRWVQHRAPIAQGAPLRADDIVVLPNDAADAIQNAASISNRIVIFDQNPYATAASGCAELIANQPARFPAIITVAPRSAALLRRLFPHAAVETIRCFADERLFRPGAKERVGAFVPRKRPFEAAAIRAMHARLHPEQRIGWIRLEGAAEAQVADAFARASVHLSLSRLESVGMTTLEAMASGCVCAGFTGIGGREYATPDNGFWVDEDDCVAAADALAQAISLVEAGGAPLRHYMEASIETARTWSYAAFRQELEAVWSRLAPDARRAA